VETSPHSGPQARVDIPGISLSFASARGWWGVDPSRRFFTLSTSLEADQVVAGKRPVLSLDFEIEGLPAIGGPARGHARRATLAGLPCAIRGEGATARPADLAPDAPRAATLELHVVLESCEGVFGWAQPVAIDAGLPMTLYAAPPWGY
jgi:hypothetical protein